MRHQTMDSPGLIVPVNEIDPILAKIISTNSPEDRLIHNFLTNTEVEGGKAPADPYDANLNTAVDLQDEDVQKLINKYFHAKLRQRNAKLLEIHTLIT